MKFEGKFMNKVLIVVLIAAISTQSWAVSICKNCKVTGVQADPRRGGTYVFVESGDWSESVNSCSGTASLKAFFVPEGSKVEATTISLSMAALVSGREIKHVFGNGDCSYFSYEGIDYIQMR